jgi:trigger factor
MLHSLSHQGISPEAFARISGRTEAESIEQGKPEAEKALRREAVLAAIAEAEGLEPTEDELVEAVRGAAPAGDRTSPQKLLDRLRASGRLDALRDDLAQRKALDLVAESAQPIPVEQARARDALWTPGGEGEQAGGGQLWTPGDRA